MSKLANLARVTTATTGTGTITLGSAIAGFLTFAQAGITDQDVVSYAIADGANREVGRGVYTASGTTLTRNVLTSTNSNAAISLSGNAQVIITALAEDVLTFSPPQGRLTLTSGTPVLLSTVSAATTIYYTGYAGNCVPIWNGVRWSMESFSSDLQNVTTDATTNPAAVAANSVYDLFVWLSGATLVLSRGPAWTSNSVRSLLLTRQNGILVNASAITNGPPANEGTYVGTIASNGTSTIDWIFGTAASGGGAGRLMVWNQYNRVGINSVTTDNGASYTYATATVRQARGSAGNQCAVVYGQTEDAATVTDFGRQGLGATAGVFSLIGIGVDSTTTMNMYTRSQNSGAGAANYDVITTLQSHPGSGVHTYSMNEQADGNTATYNAVFRFMNVLFRC